MSHSPEPWIVGGSCRLYDANGVSVALTAGEGSGHRKPEVNIANSDRIAACVNACRGITTDELVKITEWKDNLADVFEQDVINWLESRGYVVRERLEEGK